MKRAKLGRPLLDDVKKDCVLQVRFSDSELAAIKAAADAAGVKPSAWARRVLLARATEQR